MTDLVLLRELVKNDTARGHIDDIGRSFHRTGSDSLYESVHVRTSPPYRLQISLFSLTSLA